jgi:hypothetical protein
MFIQVYRSGYTQRHSEQFCQGLFLILLSDEKETMSPSNLRALVRYTSFGQLGNFMMGRARIHGTVLSLSGAYGGDGLCKNVSKELFERGVPVPRELYDAWCKGGGHNSAGKEAKAMKKWALENLKQLRK